MGIVIVSGGPRLIAEQGVMSVAGSGVVPITDAGQALSNIHVNSLKAMYGKPTGSDPMSSWSDDGRRGAALWVFALSDE